MGQSRKYLIFPLFVLQILFIGGNQKISYHTLYEDRWRRRFEINI